MNNKFNLKFNIILNKKFSTELSGYSANEVDKFLDQILEDYKNYEELVQAQIETINERTKIILDKEEEITKLKLELSNVKQQLQVATKSNNTNLYEEIEKLKKKVDQNKKN